MDALSYQLQSTAHAASSVCPDHPGWLPSCLLHANAYMCASCFVQRLMHPAPAVDQNLAVRLPNIADRSQSCLQPAAREASQLCQPCSDLHFACRLSAISMPKAIQWHMSLRSSPCSKLGGRTFATSKLAVWNFGCSQAKRRSTEAGQGSGQKTAAWNKTARRVWLTAWGLLSTLCHKCTHVAA